MTVDINETISVKQSTYQIMVNHSSSTAAGRKDAMVN